MIQTARCQLAPLTPDDLDDFIRLYTDPEVRQFLGGPANAEEIRSAFPMFVKPDPVTIHWAVRLKQDQAFVGIVSLGVHRDGFDTEVSYQLLPQWWGLGYGREVVQAAIDYALNELGRSRVIAETQIANTASCRLLERLGMGLERTVDRHGAQQAIYSLEAK